MGTGTFRPRPKDLTAEQDLATSIKKYLSKLRRELRKYADDDREWTNSRGNGTNSHEAWNAFVHMDRDLRKILRGKKV